MTIVNDTNTSANSLLPLNQTNVRGGTSKPALERKTLDQLHSMTQAKSSSIFDINNQASRQNKEQLEKARQSRMISAFR